ncbi:MAG TPA: phosphatase domain-containing protein, partial [Polyangia bacterium]
MARDEKDRRKDRERRNPVPPGGPSLLAANPPATILPPPRHVYRWDLDKTYLKTEFDTFKDLVRSAFEGAEAKQAVPGASALLRELRAGGGARICFISGSPRQMRRVLTRKLKLDGVEFDEFILKPNLRNMLMGRFRAMREQVGYKLPALLAGRAGLPAETRETCFGDDAEADGFIYSL